MSKARLQTELALLADVCTFTFATMLNKINIGPQLTCKTYHLFPNSHFGLTFFVMFHRRGTLFGGFSSSTNH